METLNIFRWRAAELTNIGRVPAAIYAAYFPCDAHGPHAVDLGPGQTKTLHLLTVPGSPFNVAFVNYHVAGNPHEFTDVRAHWIGR